MPIENARQVQGIGASDVATIVLSDQLPPPENRTPAAGMMTKASRGDHVHPRLSATASGVLGAAGEATVTFTRTFVVKPCVTVLLIESADGMPVVFKVKSWILTGGLYTGCVIKGYRSALLPTQTPMSGGGLALAAVVTGLNGVTNALTNYNVFGGNAVGAEYSFLALQPS